MNKERDTKQMEAVGQLAGGVAHALNNIFAVILSNAQFGQRELDEQHPVQEDLRDIVTAAKRGVALVDQLRSVGGRQALRLEGVNLNHVIGAMRAELEHLLGAKIALETSLADDLDLAQVDRLRVERVITDLVTSARDAMPDGGTLSITTENATSGGEVDAPGVALVMSDTGETINNGPADRIFEPFHNSGRTKKSGLSLAAARGVVIQSGGRIDVERGPGDCTSFRVWFPSASENSS
jgi:signal transduction histidine kinase